MLHSVKVDKGRVPLQGSMVEVLLGKEFGPVWLLIVDLGHLRVLSVSTAREMFEIDEIANADALTLATYEERERLALARLRLIETEIVPERRLKIPATAFDLCGEDIDRSKVWLDQRKTFLDIYMATYVQRLLRVSVSLPSKFER